MAKKTTQKRLVLLDSHAIIHRAYHALPEFLSSKGIPTGALYGLSTMLMKIITDLKPDYIVACYDLPQKTFRHEAYDAYKAGRAKTDEALIAQLKESRRIFQAFNIPMYDAPGFEADDMLGTIVEQVKKSKQGLDIVIASGDMDTLQLVDDDCVQVFTLKKGLNDTIMYNEKAVVTRFGFVPKLLPDYKGLRGDPSDNIIGVKGIGEKTATTLIQEFGTIEEMYKRLKSKEKREKILAELKKKGITERIVKLLDDNEDEAIFSKTLATIRRDAPITFVVPEKTFQDGLDLSKVTTLFAELEFRSLLARAKTLFGTPGTNRTDEEKEATPAKEEEVVDPDELLKTAIAVWLVNSDMTNPSLEDMLFFAKKDTFAEAKEVIFKKLHDQNLETVFNEIELPLVSIIKEMQETGILIDQKYFAKLSKEYHTELDLLTKNIYKLAGGEFNINSPKQLSEVLFEKLALVNKRKRGAQGAYSTKIEVLEELIDVHPVIQEIINYRELQKLLSTYIDVIPTLVGKDGRLHAEFVQHGSTTGRFSSQNPNLQNIPIKSELGRRIRDGFVAAPGKVLVASDYSQIELRVVAMLSQDKNLVNIFKEGKDVHAGVASFVFGVSQDNVDSEMRRRAKVINFGIIYGMGVSALKKNLGSSREEAQKFYDNYFTQFSGVRAYLDSVKAFALEHGYTETLFGRKRQFPNIKSRIPFLKAMAERTATNAPLQGTAADIIKLAIRFAHEELKDAGLEKKAKLILQIHDELVYEVDEAVVSKAEAIIKHAMETVLTESFLHYKTDVPLLVHYGDGKTLGEVK